jgi:hypothetical protein
MARSPFPGPSAPQCRIPVCRSSTVPLQPKSLHHPPAKLTLFSPFLRIHSCFIIGSCLLRIPNP